MEKTPLFRNTQQQGGGFSIETLLVTSYECNETAQLSVLIHGFTSFLDSSLFRFFLLKSLVWGFTPQVGSSAGPKGTTQRIPPIVSVDYRVSCRHLLETGEKYEIYFKKTFSIQPRGWNKQLEVSTKSAFEFCLLRTQMYVFQKVTIWKK